MFRERSVPQMRLGERGSGSCCHYPTKLDCIGYLLAGVIAGSTAEFPDVQLARDGFDDRRNRLMTVDLVLDATMAWREREVTCEGVFQSRRFCGRARMAELVDAYTLQVYAGNGVRVQFPLRARPRHTNI